jgi:hypothetical protein
MKDNKHMFNSYKSSIVAFLNSPWHPLRDILQFTIYVSATCLTPAG